MKAKGGKILQNIKTRWINMLNLTKQVMSMYMPFVARMVEDIPSIVIAKHNFELFYDVNLLISLSCLLPMLETIHVLIKFALKKDVFVCDFITTIKICNGQLYSHYFDLETKYMFDISKSSKIWLLTITTSYI
jgi:hypothetical protein